MPFHLDVCADYDAMSARAADLVSGRLRAVPGLVLCAATGASPEGLYARLAAAGRDDPHPFDGLRVVKLDEWGGVSTDDPGTCETYLRRHLLDPLGIPPERYLAFNSDAADPTAECRRVADGLRAWGGVDVCLLGLGHNGHLGLNEPADALVPHAHVAPLDPQTLRHPMLRGARAVPRYGLTLGMADLLQARTVVLLVSGAHKRDVLRRLLHDAAVTPRFPASFLHLHGDVHLMTDRAAMGEPA